MTVGIDEVGRGCWAGPLVAGAVLLDDSLPLLGLRDSKKLSKKQRERLDTQIRQVAVAWGLGWVTPLELDEIGLTQAVRLAMQRALAGVNAPYSGIVIDGSYNFLSEYPNVQTIIKADDMVPAVSAASILAKVARDTYMAKVAAATYPEYGFEAHVGYGTAKHRTALAAFGVTDLHRKSFGPIKKLLVS